MLSDSKRTLCVHKTVCVCERERERGLGPLAELVKSVALEAKGRGFESAIMGFYHSQPQKLGKNTLKTTRLLVTTPNGAPRHLETGHPNATGVAVSRPEVPARRLK